MLAAIIHEQRLGAALALVVAGARADRIDPAPIAFLLRVHLGIAIDLAGRGLEDLGLHALGEPQHVDRAVDRGLGRLHRVDLILYRRGRAGEIVDFVALQIERHGHVVADEIEARMAEQVRDVRLAAGEQIVDAEHVVPLPDQPVAQMRTQKSRTTGDEDALYAGRCVHLDCPCHRGLLRSMVAT